jgi:FtsP/CotA-like multicopper oxidase with cupredoxin domain
MSKTKSGILTGVLICLPLLAGTQSASAEPVPGGTLDPLTIPKYVTDLVIPPVLYDDRGKKNGMKVKVAQRQIFQQVLPETDIDGNPLPLTPLWAYGNPKDPSTFNNPSGTIEVTKDRLTRVQWSNELVISPKHCFDGKKDKKSMRLKKFACRYRPHIIQDANGDPIIDQTLHWAAPNQDCREGMPRTDCRGDSADPYLGPIPMVVHVHGAHVGPGSDGYPEAWWLPKASNIDCTNARGYPKTKTVEDDYACNGTFFESSRKAEGDDTRRAQGKGYSRDLYPNDQPSTTLWYHDHTLGITRLNVYAAGAGFWLIREDDPKTRGDDDKESGLLKGRLPGPAPKLGQDPNCSANDDDGKHKGKKCVREHIREIPLAIQPKSFNEDGTQFYPADRQFFEGLGDGDILAENDQMFSLVTPDGAFPFLPQANSDIAPIWNPEAFFNTMVVNGRTWPQLEVASERYRFRILNASDSRFLNLALFVVNAGGSLGHEIPFYQIGSDQGLLPQVVRIETGFATPLPGGGSDVDNGIPRVPGTFAQQALLVGGAERADVIVDFSGLRNGTVVRMINTAPDAPFGGFPDVPADPATTGQVMQFVVNTGRNRGGDPSTPPAFLSLDTNPGGVPKLGAPDAVQDLALLEEESALLCVVVDAVTGAVTQVNGTPNGEMDPMDGEGDGCPEVEIGGELVQSEPFAPKEAVLGVNGSGGGEFQLWDDPIAQNPALNNVEEWEFWNWSADAHPIHLHLVKFEVVNREIIGGAVRPAEPWEAGWKDMVIAYPGEVTRIKAKFDIPGLYVWHCHILSHEDNEMMVPYCVGTPGIDCPEELFPPPVM